MTIFVHILATLLGINILNLSGDAVMLAIIFGVCLDLDHLLKVPMYLKKYGLRMVISYPWRTPLQEPISLLWVAPLCAYLHTWVPLAFFSLHIALDYLMSYPKKPFSPLHNFEIRKNPLGIPDASKEGAALLVFICLNLLAL